MLSNFLINYYVFKELMCQDKYKKRKPKVKHKNARSAHIANTCQGSCAITEKLNVCLMAQNLKH